MSELAFNINGESFEFPGEITDLRVRRMKMRGAPELVYGRDGRPVTVSVNASIEELRDAVGGVAGKYRLDPLNADGKLVDGVPAAYIQVVPPVPEVSTVSLMPMPAPANEVESVLRDAIRSNSELARTVISTFPAMMESAARLIEAADGAGIPRRKPRLIEVDEESEDHDDDQDEGDDDESVAAEPVRKGGIDINAIIAQVVPVAVTTLMNGGFDLSKIGKLAELFDWRKAAAAGAKKSAAAATLAASSAQDKKTGNASTAAKNDEVGTLPPLDPSQMAHFFAIQNALAPAEAALAREVAKDLSPLELRTWLAELSAKSVPEAVAAIREYLAPMAATSYASEAVP